MTKKKLPVRFTGQHFTIDKVLIKDAIKQANITQQDTVLDIGAGKGFITVHLLKNVNKVVAIETTWSYTSICVRGLIMPKTFRLLGVILENLQFRCYLLR